MIRQGSKNPSKIAPIISTRTLSDFLSLDFEGDKTELEGPLNCSDQLDTSKSFNKSSVPTARECPPPVSTNALQKFKATTENASGSIYDR
jgi:hypothetical protein